MSLQTLGEECPSVTPRKHRIYQGSPAKVTMPKRVFAIATEASTSVWKARRVIVEADLQPGEVYITHRRIVTETDCFLALTSIGVSKVVLVYEAIEILGNDMDEYFRSLFRMAQFKTDVEIIMGSIKSSQRRATFSMFAYALYCGCMHDGHVYDAITRNGMRLFWDVLQAAAEDHIDNDALSLMAHAEEDAEFGVLKAWSKTFLLREERHQKSHPFSFISGDIGLAEVALEVLKFLATEDKQESYKELSQLLQATIPLVTKEIAKKKVHVLEEKAQEEINSYLVRMRQPRRKLLQDSM